MSLSESFESEFKIRCFNSTIAKCEEREDGGVVVVVVVVDDDD